MFKRQIHSNCRRFTPLGLLLTCVAVLGAQNAFAQLQGVEFTGWGTEMSGQGAINPTQQALTDAFNDYCESNGEDREALEQDLFRLELEARTRLGEEGMGVATDYMPEAQEQVDELLDRLDEECEDDDEGWVFSNFKITYAHCRMLMDSDSDLLDIKIPDSGADGHMLVVSGGEGMRINLTRSMQQVAQHATGQGWSSGIQWQSGPGQTKEIIGYEATSHQYEYTMGIGTGYGAGLSSSQQAAQGGMSTQEYLQQNQGAGQDQASALIAGMVSTKNQGWGYFSQEVPGVDIVQEFYENFANRVAPSGELDSFFGGMIMAMVGMLEKGIPLELNFKVESKVMGRTTVSSESTSDILNARLVSLPSDWCTREFVGPDVPIRDMDEEINQALSGQSGSPNSGVSAEQQAEIAEGMRQFQEAMDNLSPEQKAMMEQMGITPGMIPGGASGNDDGQ